MLSISWTLLIFLLAVVAILCFAVGMYMERKRKLETAIGTMAEHNAQHIGMLKTAISDVKTVTRDVAKLVKP